MGQWVKVEDRLPADTEFVWIYSEHGVHLGWVSPYKGRLWLLRDDEETLEDNITHWHPLAQPQPPLPKECIRTLWQRYHATMRNAWLTILQGGELT